MSRGTVVFGMSVFLAIGIPSCAAPVANISAADLQRDLSDKLTGNGTPPEAVTCGRELPARLGSTSRCEVVFTDSNRVDAVVTATEVDNGTVEWEITNPVLTRDQLVRRIAAQSAAQSVTCDSGLDPYVGDWAQCQATVNGVTLDGSVEVRDVEGLTMDLALDQELPQPAAEDLLLTRVTPDYGRRPDGAACAGDLPAAVGNTVTCTVTVGDIAYSYVLAVAGVPSGPIDFQYFTPDGVQPLPPDMPVLPAG